MIREDKKNETPSVQEMLADENFIHFGACQFLGGYYSSLCTSEENDNGKNYDLLIADIKTSDVSDIWSAYLATYQN